MIVEDLQQHNPMQWSPDWIQAEKFRGHTALPLIVDERSIGVLVMNNRKPRAVEDDELRFLRLMANQAALAIENARLATLEVSQLRLEDELAVGKEIQLSLLPSSIPSEHGWEFAVRYQAARQVGGDFYDFIETAGTDHHLGFVMADVSDKGVPAALFMAMSRTTIRTMALGNRSPGETLEKANQLILKDSHSDLFLSAFYGVLDPNSGSFVFANGGHNRPLHFRSSTKDVVELASQGIILGVFDEVEIEEKEITLAPGDILLLFTDGVTEAANANGDLYGVERLRAMLGKQTGRSVEEIAESIFREIQMHVDVAPVADDITFVILRRLPA